MNQPGRWRAFGSLHCHLPAAALLDGDRVLALRVRCDGDAPAHPLRELRTACAILSQPPDELARACTVAEASTET